MNLRTSPFVLFAALVACSAPPPPENLEQVDLVLDISP
jgi:hypothetical protein